MYILPQLKKNTPAQKQHKEPFPAQERGGEQPYPDSGRGEIKLLPSLREEGIRTRCRDLQKKILQEDGKSQLVTQEEKGLNCSSAAAPRSRQKDLKIKGHVLNFYPTPPPMKGEKYEYIKFLRDRPGKRGEKEKVQGEGWLLTLLPPRFLLHLLPHW